MQKINDKKFLKYIELTKHDMQEMGYTEFAHDLEHILETKKLTVVNIAELFSFLEYRIHNPKHYELEMQHLLLRGFDFNEASQMIEELKKEHKYMYKIITKYFSFKEAAGLLIVSKVNDNKEVAK